MADDWNVGDLALCVDDSRCPYFPGTENGICKGAVYQVRQVKQVRDVWKRLETGLCLDRCNPIHPTSGAEGYHNAIRFKRIRPLTDEERDSFTAELRNDQRTPVEV